MSTIFRFASVAALLLGMTHAQTKVEFEVASIRSNPPRSGFHFAESGGRPDLSSPGTFRCLNCTLATLIQEAFELKSYQFPGRTSLGGPTFDVVARIPSGASSGAVATMIQTLLRDRFGLAHHFIEKSMRGYHLVAAKNGPKLKESATDPLPPGHRIEQGANHAHNGLVTFGASSSYRGDHKSTAELAGILSDALSLPVEDQTNLPGKYDIALNWVSNVSSSSNNHAPGAWGGAGHDGHGEGGNGTPSRRDESGATLFEALQSQLGLRLVAAEQTVARVLIVDHVDHQPTAN